MLFFLVEESIIAPTRKLNSIGREPTPLTNPIISDDFVSARTIQSNTIVNNVLAPLDKPNEANRSLKSFGSFSMAVL